MSKSIKALNAFMDGYAFIRVNSDDCVDKIMTALQEEDCEVVNKIPAEYSNDFGKNVYSDNYYLTYYRKQHALKCMCSEFFEKVYNPFGKAYIIEL